MTTIQDNELYVHAERARGKVVLITGAANGIGREMALQYAKYGAKIVIGDLDVKGGDRTAAEIAKAGGTAISRKCDVTIWDDQVALFEAAVAEFGVVDIVVANAGVVEIGQFLMMRKENGKPAPPNIKTLEINLIAVVYTANLAVNYLIKNPSRDLKAMIFIGSMASWQAIPGGPMYSASKHGVLGLMRSLYEPMIMQGIRVAAIHPWFADTAIVPVMLKIVMAGIPLTPIARIAGAVICASTNPDPETSGCAWLLPDDGPVYRVNRENFKEGVYAMIDARTRVLFKGLKGLIIAGRAVQDISRLLGAKGISAVALAGAAAGYYFKLRG